MIYINKNKNAIFNLNNFLYISKMDDPTVPANRRYQIIGRDHLENDYVIIEAFDNEKERDKAFDNILARIGENIQCMYLMKK